VTSDTNGTTPPPPEGLGREADQGWGEGSPSPPPLRDYARETRRDATPAEQKLWRGFRNCRVSELKFRRQMPLGPFIVDFYCPSTRLVVELDGVSHIDSQTDDRRDAWMTNRGIRVRRFSNHDVLSNLEGVPIAIEQGAGVTPPPRPWSASRSKPSTGGGVGPE
jgi:very-short-patch-repair endonuclease